MMVQEKRTKRTGSVCLLFAVLVGMLAAPADAAKRKPKRVTREVAVTYTLPFLGSPSTGGGCFTVGPVGNDCPRFVITKRERWVTMEVDDASGTPTAFEIRQADPDGELLTSTYMGGPFCGSSGPLPVRLTPGLEVIVYVYSYGDFVCPGAVATTGTVSAVFSNAP